MILYVVKLEYNTLVVLGKNDDEVLLMILRHSEYGGEYSLKLEDAISNAPKITMEGCTSQVVSSIYTGC